MVSLEKESVLFLLSVYYFMFIKPDVASQRKSLS